MGASTSIEARAIEVAPGGEAACAVVVRNVGTVVDQFSVDVVGDARDWTVAEPAVVNLMPGGEATVVVSFRPPRSPEVAAGPTPFGIRVASKEDPAGSVVEEGTVDVAVFTDISAELVPRTVRGRRRATYELAVDNRGNDAVELDLIASDPEERLGFVLQFRTLRLEPGTTAFVKVRARPEDGFLRGPDRRFPFQLLAVGSDVETVVADGVMVHRPLLPKWLLPAMLALLALAVLLVTLWFTVFKPAVESTAREAVAKEIQAVEDTANQAAQQAAQAGETAAAAKEQTAPAPGPGQPGGPPLVQPIDFRVPIEVGPGDTGRKAGPFPEGKTVFISDLVLQNPFGDNGILRILREAGDERTVLLEVGLNNFRDLDYHYAEPFRFMPGERILLEVTCQAPGVAPPPGRSVCAPSASFSGRVEG